ncbi:hypothetical protein Slin14017_G042040 [Septoria linicola]|nr:hypothetical protein Slin14017_G042040 [Septoria linicola]
MKSQQSQSSSKPVSRTLLTIGDRKKIRDYLHRSANLTTQCISDSDAYLDAIAEGSAYAQYTRADSLKKALTLDRTLRQLADRPPSSIETIRKHAESVWTTIAIPTKGKPKFTDAWMQEFALRYRQHPVTDDTNGHRDQQNIPIDKPADAMNLAEAPSSSIAGAGVACSAYQRSVRSQRSKGPWATRPGTESAVDQDTPTRRAANTAEEQDIVLAGSSKRAYDELCSASSDEDNERRTKRS